MWKARRTRAILLSAVLIPLFLIIIIAASTSGFYKEDGSDGSADLIDVCVNHEELSKLDEAYTGEGYEWVPTARDDIYDMRTSGTFPQGMFNGSAQGNEIVQFARTFLGKPYVWGGTDPNTGADCSGFTSYVFRHFNINIHRIAKDQALDCDQIDKSQVRAADLAIWDGHVAMCEGNGMYIEAADPQHGIREIAMYENLPDDPFMGYYRVKGVKQNDTPADTPEQSQDAEQTETTDQSKAEAKAIAVLMAYYNYDDGKKYAGDSPDWNAYCKAFTNDDYTADGYDIKSDPSWQNLKNAGFAEIDDDMYDAIEFVLDALEGRIVPLGGGAANIEAIAKYPDNTEVTGQEALSLWQSIFNDAQGGKFCVLTTVPGPNYGQCTDFAHWCFYETYHCDWAGSGNGNQTVGKICATYTKNGNRTPDGYYFVESDTPEPGAVFSTGFNEQYGHTGFITKVENGYFWASEGNYRRDPSGNFSSIKVNEKYAMSRSQNWVGNRGGVKYAVPRKD